jgi:CRISPR type III-B/RAMP module RAMP protein Cmr6
VVTNHHRDYYAGAGRARADPFPPLDLESPVPVCFLTVAPRTCFVFRLLPRTSQDSPELVLRAMHFLETGLSLLGIGAKSSSGLGAMLPAVEP